MGTDMTKHNFRLVELLVSEVTRNRVKRLKGNLTYDEFISKLIEDLK